MQGDFYASKWITQLPPFPFTDLLPDMILTGVLQGLYAPESVFCLESTILAGPSLGLQRTLPTTDSL